MSRPSGSGRTQTNSKKYNLSLARLHPYCHVGLSGVKFPASNTGKGVVIPPKRSRKQPREYDKHLFRARHLVEQFLNKLKQYRSLATRYDMTARNFLGAIQLAVAVIWLNS